MCLTKSHLREGRSELFSEALITQRVLETQPRNMSSCHRSPDNQSTVDVCNKRMSGKTFDFLGWFPKRPLQCCGCLWGAISKIVVSSGVWVCLTCLMPPPPAALPLHSSSHEQTHFVLESCTFFASVRWHACPRFVDSRFVMLTSCNPTRDSSTLFHIPKKANARIAFRT